MQDFSGSLVLQSQILLQEPNFFCFVQGVPQSQLWVHKEILQIFWQAIFQSNRCLRTVACASPVF